MAKNATTVEAPKRTAEEVREAIRNAPRQSQKRLVEYFNILDSAAPDRVSEFFSEEDEAAIRQVAATVRNPIEVAVEKATQAQVELAVKALSNVDEKNGYANFRFNAEDFAAKTAPKQPRVKKSVVDKVESQLETASDEDLEALAALLKARGINV